MKKWS